MRFILFCNQPYAFSILRPLELELMQRGYAVLWYVPAVIKESFSFLGSQSTSLMEDLIGFQSDAIFVPGNDVPHYLRGVKVQVFHGLASEKKGHFRIRDYFDLYLTQGPHFTEGFNALVNMRDDVKVVETGWSKLDALFTSPPESHNRKQQLLKEYKSQFMIVFAPTFSPKLTSATILFDVINQIADMDNVLLVCKFHDLMDKDIVKRYQECMNKSLIVSDEIDVLPLLKMADILISDTSSIVYEFILLDKPVVSYLSQSKNIVWENVHSISDVLEKVREIMAGHDRKKADRAKLKKTYHPYSDGKSSCRMIDEVERYIAKFGVPISRKISMFRKFKVYKKYGVRSIL
jgi:hypothetical protein